MFEEREVLSLGVWLCVAGFAFWQRHKLRLAIPHYPVLIISFSLLSFSAFFLVIEGVFWNREFNLLQHFSAGISSLFKKDPRNP